MLELLFAAGTGAATLFGYLKARQFVRERLRFVDVAHKPVAPLVAGAGGGGRGPDGEGNPRADAGSAGARATATSGATGLCATSTKRSRSRTNCRALR